MSLTTPQAASVPLYAGFWRRAAASLVDAFILVVPAIVIDLVVGQTRALAFLINIVMGCAYFGGFHSSAKQATPGKMAFGVKVSDVTGARIGLVRAVGRYFAMWLSWFIVGIGYLMAAFTEKKRALHDVMTGTLVVNANTDSDEIVAGGGVMPVTAGVRMVIILLIVVPVFGGILAGIAVPAYQDYAVRRKIVEGLTEISQLRSEVQQAYATKQPVTTASIQVASPSVKSVEVSSIGVIVITLVPEVAGGGTIVYTPSMDSAGTMSWRCSSRGVPPKYLPTDCRHQ